MRLILASLCLLAMTTAPFVQCLKIDFNGKAPVSGSSAVKFTWTREQGDTDTVWLKKQKLDDKNGKTTLSDPFPVIMTGFPVGAKGEGTILFNRPGKFKIFVFKDSNDNFGKQLQTIDNVDVVEPSTTIAGTSSDDQPSDAQSSSTTPVLPTNPVTPSNQPSTGEKIPARPDVALIVGLTLGLLLLAVLVVLSLLCLRRRRQREGHPQHQFQKNRMIHAASGLDPEKQPGTAAAAPHFPHPFDYSVPPKSVIDTDESFSVTSPIERHRRRSDMETDISTSEYGLPVRARTDRQMWIEERVRCLQAELIPLSMSRRGTPSSPGTTRPLPTPPSSNVYSGNLERRIDLLMTLAQSDWALGLTNVRPEGLARELEGVANL